MKNLILSFALLIGLVFIASASAPPVESVAHYKTEKVSPLADKAVISAVYSEANFDLAVTVNHVEGVEASPQPKLEKLYATQINKYASNSYRNYKESRIQNTQTAMTKYRRS
jgi:hypothetical protein